MPADENILSQGSKPRSSRARRRPDPGKNMIPRLLILVFVFIVLFEGRIIRTLVTHRVSTAAGITASAERNQAGDSSSQSGTDHTSLLPGSNSSGGSSGDVSPAAGLAGLASLDGGNGLKEVSTSESEASSQPSGEQIDSAAVVPEQTDTVDDSYFSDAVFIGDSRMEGFRNASGITQGTFLTGVGLSINDMDKQIIASADGTISVYQGLSGRQYKKIYLMLGTNDLGFYPWEDFQPKFESVIRQFHQLQPGAIIYVCSVIYVEESKIAAGFEYDNNENVMTINKYILGTCEDLWYSYYVNLNEVFSDGYNELIPGASADGVHLQAEYCVTMLDYLKSHYITDDMWSSVRTANGEGDASAAGDETEAATEADASADSSDISAG